MTLIEWFRQYETPIIFGIIVLLGLSCFGIGLWLGLDSKDAQVKQLKARNSELTVTLVEATIIISLLEVRLKSLADLMKHFMDEEKKSRDYNETAIE